MTSEARMDAPLDVTSTLLDALTSSFSHGCGPNDVCTAAESTEAV